MFWLDLHIIGFTGCLLEPLAMEKVSPDQSLKGDADLACRVGSQWVQVGFHFFLMVVGSNVNQDHNQRRIKEWGMVVNDVEVKKKA